MTPAADSADGKRKSNDGESDRKKAFAKKLKVAKAYVAEIEKQTATESECNIE